MKRTLAYRYAAAAASATVLVAAGIYLLTGPDTTENKQPRNAVTAAHLAETLTGENPAAATLTPGTPDWFKLAKSLAGEAGEGLDYPAGAEWFLNVRTVRDNRFTDDLYVKFATQAAANEYASPNTADGSNNVKPRTLEPLSTKSGAVVLIKGPQAPDREPTLGDTELPSASDITHGDWMWDGGAELEAIATLGTENAKTYMSIANELGLGELTMEAKASSPRAWEGRLTPGPNPVSKETASKFATAVNESADRTCTGGTSGVCTTSNDGLSNLIRYLDVRDSGGTRLGVLANTAGTPVRGADATIWGTFDPAGWYATILGTGRPTDAMPALSFNVTGDGFISLSPYM